MLREPWQERPGDRPYRSYFLMSAVCRARKNSCQTFFYPGLQHAQETVVFQVGAGFLIRKLAALFGACLVDGAALTHAVICKKDAGTVFPGFKGISPLNKSMAHFTIGKGKMTGYPVDINCHDREAGPLETVAATARTVVTKGFIAGKRILIRLATHERNSRDWIP